MRKKVAATNAGRGEDRQRVIAAKRRTISSHLLNSLIHSVDSESGFVMADGTVFHSQEDEEKMRQHKTKLAKQNANAR